MRAGSRPRTDGPPQPERSAVTRRSAAGESSRRGPTEAEALAAAKFAYNPALDGLRVVCIYIILAGHMGAIRASNVAVDMFCVLSGFLITTLLLAEQARTGTIAIGKFLVRRSFRLMPGMWFYLLVGLAVTVAFKWDDIPYRDDFFKTAISTFFNVNNWYRIVNPEAGGRWLPHVWSLSMEEQFYLIWPGAFLLFMRSRRLRPYLLMFLVASVGLVIGWTYVCAASGAVRTRVYFGLDTHIAPLLIGCMVAIWRDNRLRALAGPAGTGPAGDSTGGEGKGRERPARGAASAVTMAAVQRWTTGRRLAVLGLPAGIAMLVLCFAGPSKEQYLPNWIDYAAYVPTAALGAILILGCDVNREARWVKLLGAPKMAWLGKITYSIYLWHYPFISASAGQVVPRIGLWPGVFVAAVGTTIAAYLANRFIEKPIQARRPKWSDTPRGPARPRDDAAGPSPADAPRPDSGADRSGPAPGRDLPDLPELAEVPESLELPDPRDRERNRDWDREPVAAMSRSDGDVDWVDEGYPQRDRDPLPAQGGWRGATGLPVASGFGRPQPGDVTYDRPDGPAVYEHGPAVGAVRTAGMEPTPVPDWARYPSTGRHGPDDRVPAGDPRAAASVVGETMNLQLPALTDPRADPGRRPTPTPRPGHDSGHHGRAFAHGPVSGQGPGHAHGPVSGHDTGGRPPAGRPGPGPGRDRHPGPAQGPDHEYPAGRQPAGTRDGRDARAGRSERESAQPDPLFGPIPGAGGDW
ncbi:acyltransferase [Frankia sp. CcI49]|uniref:acyltransferase family protein n=1 Tax=Frankia sp. CcI49 TaxID=1745382 RepID=UPI0009764E4C|nr:acyltransferase [Frankia sp. CcI49]ONH59587.1 acyltransferase [Frankia sp. CcI49]